MKKTSELSHPMQPIGEDKHGVMRFKENEIVRFLLEQGTITLNDIAATPFPREDREQFAQLIGYSVSGWGDLSYVDPDSITVADTIAENGGGKVDESAELKILKQKLERLRGAVKKMAEEIFAIHPDDLNFS